MDLNQLNKQLANLRPGDKIELQCTEQGDIVVIADDMAHKTKEDILKEKWPGLIGRGITLSEAARKYDVPRSTIESWLYRSGYIKKIEDSYPLQVDEAEVAYCTEIYNERRAVGSKAPLLNEKGLPYTIQWPRLAEIRRQKREK